MNNTMMFIYFIAFTILRSTPGYSVPNEYAPSSSNPLAYGKIDQVHCLVNDISKLYLNEENSDVVLDVDNEKFHAHRIVLASRSDYFKRMLYGKYKEAREMKVPIEEASASSFKLILEYIYFGKMNLNNLEGYVVVELLGLSNYFQLSNLFFLLAEYLRGNVSLHNVCSMLTVARLYQLKDLEDESLKFIDIHALDVLESEDYLSLSPEEFQLILSRDMAYADELDIRVFRATCRWIEKNQDKIDAEAKNKVLSAVRYQYMNDEELSEVKRSQLVCSATVFLESLTHVVEYQEQLEPNVNFAQRILEEPTQIDGGTMIKLDHPSHINYIEMMLCDEDSRTYSYYIEVSLNQSDWLRVINHSKYHCHLVQRLWFHQRFVQYIRIIGTKNTENKTFKFLKIMYNTEKMNLVEIKNGLVVPKYNVASASMNATVDQGFSPSGYKSMVDGDYKNNRGGKKYLKSTFHHRKSSEFINIQLAQPYVLSSMRILVWDIDSGMYDYTVLVSVNNLNWKMIDMSPRSFTSWISIKFDARPVVYIRITGSFLSKKYDFFGCVHIETPVEELPKPNDAPLQPKQQRSILKFFSK